MERKEYCLADTLINPITEQDIQQIKINLFNNIATKENIFTKIVNNEILISIPGAVVASPSQPGSNFSQDYLFHWVRDGAIVMNEVAHLYEESTDLTEKTWLKEYLFNYVEWVRFAQMQSPLNNINVLGEPKFNINGTVWMGEWARPQNDGPALRAISLMHIAEIFLKEGNQDYVTNKLFNSHLSQEKMGSIKIDLEYTANHWLYETAGLWEEIFSHPFFTELVQRRALVQGAKLAHLLGDPEAGYYYLEQAKHIERLIDSHWNENMGYYSEALHDNLKGGGINSSIILGILYGRLPNLNDIMAVDHERNISSAYYIRYSFEGLYRINLNNNAQDMGPLIGRYPGDVYDGDRSTYGNPWVLTTGIFAKYYYSLANQFLIKKNIKISELTAPFFKQINPQLNINKTVTLIKNEDDNFNQIIFDLIRAGDAMLRGIKYHSIYYSDTDYFHLSEQIDRRTGQQVSAKDLTWSYCSILAAYRTRKALMQSLDNMS